MLLCILFMQSNFDQSPPPPPNTYRYKGGKLSLYRVVIHQFIKYRSKKEATGSSEAAGRTIAAKRCFYRNEEVGGHLGRSFPSGGLDECFREGLSLRLRDNT